MVIVMVRNTAVLCVALMCSHVHAQMTEDQAILEARRYISSWAPENLGATPVVLRDTMEVRGMAIEYFMIHFGDAVATLLDDGALISYYNMSSAVANPPGRDRDRYVTDEQAWDALEETITTVDLPSGLERSKLEREDREGQRYAYKFTMKPSPYGYADSGGNLLVAELHRTTGRVLSMSVVSGWTYEAPDVRVSEQAAIAKAVAHSGGEPSEWRTNLKYSTTAYESAPEYFKPLIEQQVMRLLYVVEKYDVQSGTKVVVVDSVTGSVIGSATYAVDSHSGVRADAASLNKPADQAAESGRVGTGETAAKPGPTPPFMALAIGIVAALIAAVGAVALMRFRGKPQV